MRQYFIFLAISLYSFISFSQDNNPLIKKELSILNLEKLMGIKSQIDDSIPAELSLFPKSETNPGKISREGHAAMVVGYITPEGSNTPDRLIIRDPNYPGGFRIVKLVVNKKSRKVKAFYDMPGTSNGLEEVLASVPNFDYSPAQITLFNERFHYTTAQRPSEKSAAQCSSGHSSKLNLSPILRH